jgi:hypothetical protein
VYFKKKHPLSASFLKKTGHINFKIKPLPINFSPKIIPPFYENNQSTSPSRAQYMEHTKKKIDPNAIGFGRNGTISNQ